MDPAEDEWLENVAARLWIIGPSASSMEEVPAGIGLTDRDVTTLLRIAKVAADTTGVRYLAPLTTFLVGRTMGERASHEPPPTVQEMAQAIDELAKEWPQKAS